MRAGRGTGLGEISMEVGREKYTTELRRFRAVTTGVSVYTVLGASLEASLVAEFCAALTAACPGDLCKNRAATGLPSK